MSLLDEPKTEAVQLKSQIKEIAAELGFDDVKIANCDLSESAPRLKEWIDNGYAGDMDFIANRLDMKVDPEKLVHGVKRIISLRMNYFQPRDNSMRGLDFLACPDKGFVSSYALGRDYHKVIRKRLEKVARNMQSIIGPFGYRVFTDSAPVMEVELAVKSGLGWRGKHTLLINKDVGSWFFLGEIYTDLDLPVDNAEAEHCGTCRRCIDICPTNAIIGPYKLDARRCISYLTIEHKGSIPKEFRKLIGNRIYGCDDCQLVCPWNKYASVTEITDFNARDPLDGKTLVSFFSWTEVQFLQFTEGSAIRRIGYERWLRNVACALGNAPTTPELIKALESKKSHNSAMVREHVLWALDEHHKFLSRTS
ncbi:tRNA epoxyqueuosine(34) reductase QueG [Burkholderiales bacterium]|nr:tRNA epoxyqueuosine(34) reductase QueG [Burkholderiales bacterium]